MSSDPNGLSIYEFVEEIDKKHADAHTRVRLDLRDAERTIESNYQHFSTVTDLLRAKVSALESDAKQPVDATSLVMPVKATVAIVCSALVVAASIWALNTKIDAQREAANNAAMLAAEQMKTVREQIADNQRKTELLRYEVQELNKVMLKGKQP